jgi:hypothetical protein
VLNVWTGSPLLAVWLGSRVQGEESQPSMAAFAVVLVSLIVFSLVLYQLLKLTMRAYRETTGTTPTVRTRAAWLRSMRDERPGSPEDQHDDHWRRTRRGAHGRDRGGGFRGLVLLLLRLADRRPRRTLTGRHRPHVRLRFVGHAPVAQLERAAAF